MINGTNLLSFINPVRLSMARESSDQFAASASIEPISDSALSLLQAQAKSRPASETLYSVIVRGEDTFEEGPVGHLAVFTLDWRGVMSEVLRPSDMAVPAAPL